MVYVSEMGADVISSDAAGNDQRLISRKKAMAGVLAENRLIVLLVILSRYQLQKHTFCEENGHKRIIERGRS